MEEIIFSIEEREDGGYRAKALGYSIYTEADTMIELREFVRDAVHCHFEDNSERPKMIRLHLVKDELIAA